MAVSRVCCCLRVCLLGQFQPKANQMVEHLTSLNLVTRNCRIKHLDSFPTSHVTRYRHEEVHTQEVPELHLRGDSELYSEVECGSLDSVGVAEPVRRGF